MDMFVLDHLQTILNKAGVDDQQIINGVQFTPAGYHKLADIMGVAFDEINPMINELITKLRDEPPLMEGMHFDRYSYEKDIIGNVTVRDAESGDEQFFRGSEAAELLNALALDISDEQNILSYYMDEPLRESVDDDDTDSYLPEIESNRGSYNFPWSYEYSHGTATVEYSGEQNLKMKLVSIRDENGEEIALDQAGIAALKQQAIDFMDKV